MLSSGFVSSTLIRGGRSRVVPVLWTCRAGGRGVSGRSYSGAGVRNRSRSRSRTPRRLDLLAPGVGSAVSRGLSARPSVEPQEPAELKADIRTKRAMMERPHTDSSGRVYLKGLTLPQLEAWVESLGERRFRARQLWAWLYKEGRLACDFESMTDMAKTFREKLGDIARADALTIDTVHEAADGTKKVLYKLDTGGVVESVIIPANGRTTVCVSSQSGCALNCAFCHTGAGGFRGHLSTAEIVDQVVLARRHFGDVTHCVFMGEGEPLHNVNSVLAAVEIMLDKDGLNMSHNKVTVSTSGLVPELIRYARESKANLAVSLHACNDELRSWLMPINRKYPLKQLMGALRDEFPRRVARQRKVFFEYVMLKGVNDSIENAQELLRVTSGVPCKVNLIKFNSHPNTPFTSSSDETIEAFRAYLADKGLLVTIRQSRGDDKMAACGQLGKQGARIAPLMRVPEKYKHALQQ